MALNNQSATPFNIDHVESLILSLYQPANPEDIAATQATLTQLHSSPLAWSLARDLLSRPDEKVKFHGALIIIVKLNTESKSLSYDDAAELLMNLIGWYLQSLSSGNSPLVTRKLASALATFLMQFHTLWSHYIHHLIVCLASGQVNVPPADSPQPDFHSALESLGPIQIQAALWVVENVIEDASKLDLNSGKNAGLYDVLRNSMPAAVALMLRALSQSASSHRIHEESIKCLQAWIWFSQRTSARDKYFMDSLRPLLAMVIDLLSVDGASDTAVETLVDVLTNFPALFVEEHYNALTEILCSQWSQQRYEQLIQGDFDFESFQFGQLLLSFGEARIDRLMRSGDEQSRNLLRCICGLLSAEGYPAVEDKIFVPALEFWSTYAETLTDELDSSDKAPGSWEEAALACVLQAVSNAWQKICFPPPQEFSQWDTADRVGFSDARKEVADLLQSTFALTGPKLVFTFANLMVTALNESAWARLEAAAFCLASLADCVREDAQTDEALHSVFSSSLFTRLRTDGAEIPHRVRQTCVSLVEHYTEYFERHTSLLPATLTMLFSLVGEQGLTSQAAKSIYRLCSSCRHHLFPEIGSFLDEYQRISTSNKLDCVSNEKLLGAISCVTQETPDELQRLAAFNRLLSFVEADLTRSLDLSASSGSQYVLPCAPNSRCLGENDYENPSLHMGIRVLRSLVSMGRGCQSPADVPIEVDQKRNINYQYDAELSELQRKIFSMVLRIESTFPTSAEVIETICQFLRTGFSESEPGPFVFSSKDIAQYLTRHDGHVPRIGALVSTACSFVSSVDQHNHQEKEPIFGEVFHWIIGLARALPDPETDTELTQHTIDFSSRLIAKSPSTILHLEPFDAAEFLLLFTVRVLNGKEPLPKAASADFWAALLNLRTESTELQARHSQIITTLGPLLGQSLANNIGGFASRSELDKLSEPLKKLVNRYPSAKQWLEAGLNDTTFPSSKVTTEDKSMFVKKIISLRGSRTTNQVVRDFWLTARGSNFAYAS